MKIQAFVLILISIANLGNSMPNNQYECSNPNNRKGMCISLYACPTLLKLFLNSGIYDNFLQKSYCGHGFGASPFVCCSNDVELFSEKLPATQEECTRDSYLSLALWPLSYAGSICAGSLINYRYVLTSAWCAANARKEILLLGTANTNGITIEKRIPHENYTYSKRYGFDHDIGLLRLSQNIVYTNDVGPSCLPSAVIGFGSYKNGDYIRFPVYSGNNINLKEGGEVVEKCKNDKYPAANQICVGGDISKYYNDMKFGNPLVAKYNGAWIIDAVYGFHRTQSYAVVARVSDYEKWIHENLEP